MLGKDSRLADMMRRGTTTRESDRVPDRAQDLRVRAETAPPAASTELNRSVPKREEMKMSSKEREREKLEALRREREQKEQRERDQKEQKDQKEEKEKKERKEGASVVLKSSTSSSSGGEREMSSREKALARQKEKERAKLKK